MLRKVKVIYNEGIPETNDREVLKEFFKKFLDKKANEQFKKEELCNLQTTLIQNRSNFLNGEYLVLATSWDSMTITFSFEIENERIIKTNTLSNKLFFIDELSEDLIEEAVSEFLECKEYFIEHYCRGYRMKESTIESIIEISMIANTLLNENKITIDDSIVLKKAILELANEFEKKYISYDFSIKNDYIETIDKFARKELITAFKA